MSERPHFVLLEKVTHVRQRPVGPGSIKFTLGTNRSRVRPGSDIPLLQHMDVKLTSALGNLSESGYAARAQTLAMGGVIPSEGGGASVGAASRAPGVPFANVVSWCAPDKKWTDRPSAKSDSRAGFIGLPPHRTDTRNPESATPFRLGRAPGPPEGWLSRPLQINAPLSLDVGLGGAGEG